MNENLKAILNKKRISSIDFTKELLKTHAAYEKEISKISGTYSITNTTLIPVMSLLHYRLNLTTERAGRGSIYTFDKLGEIQKIPYIDLRKIVLLNRSFADNVFFFVLHSKSIDSFGLRKPYNSFFTEENMIIFREAIGSADISSDIFDRQPSERLLDDRCDYCGYLLSKDDPACPQCGAPRKNELPSMSFNELLGLFASFAKQNNLDISLNELKEFIKTTFEKYL